MTLLIGTSRVVFAMSRDWLLPPWLGKTNPRTGTPLRICVIVGTVVALVAALTPVGKLEFMINIGTLSAFLPRVPGRPGPAAPPAGPAASVPGAVQSGAPVAVSRLCRRLVR
jgi:hypothetical protein